jgi:large subunit ribosomal protein L25
MATTVSNTISAKSRDAGNKGQARKLRAEGFVPAVAYGPASKPQFLAVQPKEFTLQRFTYGLSHLYEVDVEGKSKFKALLKEIQVDPVTRQLLHVDLYAVDMKRPLRVEVPIELTGKPAGIIDGGLLSQVLRVVEVQCLPDQIPAKLVADVSPLKVGDSLHLSDLALPEGVKLTAHGDEAVALVIEPDEAPVAATPAEAAAAAGAAAPAAGAAAPAAAAKTPAKK